MSDKPKAKHLRVVKTGEDHEQLIKAEDPKPVSVDTIEVLEVLLRAAKDGEIVGLAAVIFMPDDEMGMNYVGDISYAMIGGLEALKLDILSELQADDD